MCDNETAVQHLLSYLEETEELIVRLPKEKRKELSIARWVAEELITALMDHPWDNVCGLVDTFSIKMLYFSSQAQAEGHYTAKKIFSNAALQASRWFYVFLEEGDTTS